MAEPVSTGNAGSSDPPGTEGGARRSSAAPRRAAKGKSGARSTGRAGATKGPSAAGSAAGGSEQFAEVRRSLSARLAELREEHRRLLSDIQDLQRDRVSDGAGDDQADAGTKTFEREQELALAAGLLERIGQVEHALARLDEGTYETCERCGNPIGQARLEAFPSVTLCVACKQLEERR